jgi:hypothetical protein
MGSANPAIDTAFPRWRLAVVLSAALAFFVFTMVDVATGREDWPVSPYPMYSEIPGRTASRYIIVGASDQGEFKLTDDQTSPFRGSRLLSLNKSMERRPAKRAQFMQKIKDRYDSRREQMGWPELRGIRFYTEVWQLRDDLVGLNDPERRLTSTTYFPPRPLLERLEAEAAHRAAAEPPLKVAAGDIVVDLGAQHCETACTAFGDALAAGATALRLAPPSDGKAALRVPVELPAGKAFVYLRMRTDARPGSDRVRVELDGKPLASNQSLGNYRGELPEVGWVWASLAPGEPPLVLDNLPAGAHVLRLTSEVAVDVDELWLSRRVPELPSENRIREP